MKALPTKTRVAILVSIARSATRECDNPRCWCHDDPAPLPAPPRLYPDGWLSRVEAIEAGRATPGDWQ